VLASLTWAQTVKTAVSDGLFPVSAPIRVVLSFTVVILKKFLAENFDVKYVSLPGSFVISLYDPLRASMKPIKYS